MRAPCWLVHGAGVQCYRTPAGAAMMPDMGSEADGAVWVDYRGAYAWPAMLAWLAARAVDGVEACGPTEYRRTFHIDGEPGVVSVTPAPTRSAIAVRLSTLRPVPRAAILSRLVRVLDLDRDLEDMAQQLGGDPWMATLLARHPGVRVPGGWEPFELAVRAVLGQQVTVTAARGLVSQVVQICGEPLPPSLVGASLHRTFPTPRAVAAADLSPLRMPGSRRATLTALARAAVDDPRLFDPTTPLEASLARLCAVKGIGAWTAHYIALRALRAPDAFPASDVGLLRGAASETGVRPSPAVLLARAEAWRPCRAYAAQLLWTEERRVSAPR